MHRTNQRLAADLEVVVRRRTPVVIASVGSPEPVIAPVHDCGGLVFADIASMRHAGKAIGLGVDGLILWCAGAGGQTGWANPFAFVRAARAIYDGSIILSGGIADGAAVRAAVTLGADLDPDKLDACGGIEIGDDIKPEKKRWRDIWSAGHGVGAVHAVPSVAELVAELKAGWA